MSVVKKKKHVSKKNKKDWRKHCDIRDVEEFLEDQRLEERLGKFETKPDSELFVLDTLGVDTDNVVVKEEKPGLTAKQRKREKLTAMPKCFEVLLSTSKVEDPNAKRNHVNPFGTKSTALSKITEKRKTEKGIYQKQLDLAKKNRKIALEKKRKVKQYGKKFDMDMWGDGMPEAKGIPETLKEEFLSEEAVLHNVLPQKRLLRKPKISDRLARTPAVEVPHPGVSYNPTYQEHQELLQQVVTHEQKLIKKEQHLHRVTTKMFSRLTPNEKEEQWRTEMCAGLPAAAGRTHDDDGSDGEYRAVNPPVKNKKKDHKARRKQKERLAEMERLKRKKIDQKKITDLYRLRRLAARVEAAARRRAAARAARARRRAARAAAAAPALGPRAAPAAEPALCEPAALSGDLRRLRARGDLLRDRYVSLQRRGALAGAKIMMKKKKRVKAYFKAGHKVTDQDVERYLERAAGKK